MGDETSVGFALGLSASVLFVVSYVPQLCLLWEGDHSGVSPGMFVLQLVSGGVWITYGIVERSASVVLFGALSTLFRLAILGSLLRHRTASAGARGTVVLAGGGALPYSVWRAVAAAARGTTVVVVSWAKEDPVEAEVEARRACRRLWWAGCRATSDASRWRSASAIWMTGGSAAHLLKRVRATPGFAKKLSELRDEGGFVGGTSAGAIVLGAKGGGLGIVPWDVCAHASRNAGAATLCLTESTAALVSAGVVRTVGRGGLVLSASSA